MYQIHSFETKIKDVLTGKCKDVFFATYGLSSAVFLILFSVTQWLNKKYKSVFDLKQEKNISLSPFKYYVVAPYLKIHSLCCFCCD